MPTAKGDRGSYADKAKLLNRRNLCAIEADNQYLARTDAGDFGILR
jgi:hypothetical protein